MMDETEIARRGLAAGGAAMALVTGIFGAMVDRNVLQQAEVRKIIDGVLQQAEESRHDPNGSGPEVADEMRVLLAELDRHFAKPRAG